MFIITNDSDRIIDERTTSELVIKEGTGTKLKLLLEVHKQELD